MSVAADNLESPKNFYEPMPFVFREGARLVFVGKEYLILSYLDISELFCNQKL
jgi:hypothetical protein